MEKNSAIIYQRLQLYFLRLKSKRSQRRIIKLSKKRLNELGENIICNDSNSSAVNEYVNILNLLDVYQGYGLKIN